MTRATTAAVAKIAVLALFAIPHQVRLAWRLTIRARPGCWLHDAPDWFVGYVVAAGPGGDKMRNAVYKQAVLEREFRQRTGVSK